MSTYDPRSVGMSPTWLIQRLNRPTGFDNPFSFGGGMANGGLSGQAMDLIRGIFSFDYMGSAEFEWGAVPKALQKIAREASHHKVVTGEYKGAYYICSKSHLQGVKSVIDQLLENEYRLRLKEYCGLADALGNRKTQPQRTVGWLELDNGFFFFTDKEMYEKTKRLFGVK